MLTQLINYLATFRISFNLIKYIVQHSKYGGTFRNIPCNTGRMCLYCRTHNVSVFLYIAYIACGSASLCKKKTLYFLLTVLALSAAATVANIKIRYAAKIPQFAIFGTRVIYVFYSIYIILACRSPIRIQINPTDISLKYWRRSGLYMFEIHINLF